MKFYNRNRELSELKKYYGFASLNGKNALVDYFLSLEEYIVS